jgi:hypothetical protein
MSSRDRHFQICGWLLFIICAALFLVSAARNHDTPYFAGSAVFLVACIVFLVPLLRRGRD